jgi:hypothetical protein
LTSWSGGKTVVAMMQAIHQGFIPKVVLNMMNENGKISRSMGYLIYYQTRKRNCHSEGIQLRATMKLSLSVL